VRAQAIPDGERSRYDQLLELTDTAALASAATEIDRALRDLNVEYEAKRASGRLERIS